MIHDKERVEVLRAAAKVGIDALNELQAKTTDSGFHEMLVVPRHWFGDIESFFLSQLENENQDRTPAAEAFWLDAAEGSVATFGITRESPLGGPRYTANPNTLWIRRV